MRKIGPALIASLVPLSVVALVNAGAAQPGGRAGTPGTRLITLGTVAGPPPRPHRAQSSNLLIVNGTLYVIDAGDEPRAGLRRLDSTSVTSAPSSSRITTTTTPLAWAR
jgi:hypothetical protein